MACCFSAWINKGDAEKGRLCVDIAESVWKGRQRHRFFPDLNKVDFVTNLNQTSPIFLLSMTMFSFLCLNLTKITKSLHQTYLRLFKYKDMNDENRDVILVSANAMQSSQTGFTLLQPCSPARREMSRTQILSLKMLPCSYYDLWNWMTAAHPCFIQLELIVQ